MRNADGLVSVTAVVSVYVGSESMIMPEEIISVKRIVCFSIQLKTDLNYSPGMWIAVTGVSRRRNMSGGMIPVFAAAGKSIKNAVNLFR